MIKRHLDFPANQGRGGGQSQSGVLIPLATDTQPTGLAPTIHHPATAEVDYTAEELEFLKAIDAYKSTHHRPFPTWKEVLAVLRSLGYHKSLPTGSGTTSIL